ncbi:MAG TPA: GH1 family beta-glucosidase [Ktedonobacterales bacterium]|nr:GH1 family beta-glucosidase [Ktedonobacterales bacterium]
MRDRLTIQDIARLAGVSTATVSRVLNQKPDVDPATRERILNLMDEYGFVPDFSAMRLASNQGRKSRVAGPAFPASFLWGAATSAYQIEGATNEDGRGPCIWDAFAREPGTTHHGESGAVACDHYHHMPEDVALMGQLNLNAYRFSISWPRILPQGGGALNERGLDFYDRLVDTLLAQGICPMATLYHWDLPLTLHEQGGWLNRDTAHVFADYAEIVARRLGDRVAWWITLNEPWCSAYLGYGLGVHAPGVQDPQAAVAAAHHLLLGHGLAAARIRATAQARAQVGITLNLTPITPADDHAETIQGAERADILHNRWLLDPLFQARYPERLFADLGAAPPAMEDEDMALISAPLDFLGINYYSRALIRAPQPTRGRRLSAEAYEYVVPVPEASYTQMAWEIYPQGLLEALVRVHRDYAPPLILVTENGAAFDDQWDGRNHIPDKRRTNYLSEHIQVLEEALRQGVPVGGYFAWSLLDNFEWVDGYKQRYGLIYVDYLTQRRIIKESGRWYAAFIAAQRHQENAS